MSTHQSSFWARMGLEESHREVCLQVVRELYPEQVVEEFGDQGYCSFTIRVSQPEYTPSSTERSDESSHISNVEETETLIVQIRPEQHSLNLSIAHAASQTYGIFTPQVLKLECHLPGRLQAFEMDMIPGLPFSRCQPQTPTLSETNWKKQVTLVQSLATFIARAWPSSSYTTYMSRNIRADSPMTDTPSLLSACTGKVGANILPKLQKLARELQDSAPRERAVATLENITKLENYPVVLNHGDLIPSNVLVDEHTGEVTGVVDWAEAEWLPFGTCLYGLEFLLGYLDYSIPPCSIASTCSDSASTSTSASSLCPEDAIEPKPLWRYYTEATRLRELFWARLYEEAPGLSQRRGELMLARDLGVLLWFGYAWDEGRIDRVVNKEHDAVEVECLRAFLCLE